MKTGFKKRKIEDLSLNELSIKVHITLCLKKRKTCSNSQQYSMNSALHINEIVKIKIWIVQYYIFLTLVLI